MGSLNSRWEDEHAAERTSSSGNRWRWHLLAFVPSLVLAVIVAWVPLSQGMYATHEWSAAQQAVEDILFAASCVPFVTPVYLYFLGRNYVRKVHGGLKSAAPFALMYFGANLVLWLLVIFLIALGYSGR
jgi:hypothetical protein